MITSPSMVHVATPKTTTQCSLRWSWVWYDSRLCGFTWIRLIL